MNRRGTDNYGILMVWYFVWTRLGRHLERLKQEAKVILRSTKSHFVCRDNFENWKRSELCFLWLGEQIIMVRSWYFV